MSKPADKPVKLVRLSVAIPVSDHAKLCGLAASRQVDRSELAAGFIRAGLKGVRFSDPARPDNDDSESEETESPGKDLRVTRNGQPSRL